MKAVDSAEDTSAAARDWAALAERIRAWGAELGFARVGIADLDVASAADRLDAWLADGRHGAMEYMQRHAAIRRDATRLLPGARRAIVARMDYVPRDAPPDWLERERRARDRSRRGDRLDLRARPRLSQGRCASGCRRWRRASKARSVRSATASRPTRRR